MVAWLKRAWPSMVIDAQVVAALVYPGTCSYLRWVMLAIYVVLSRVLWVRLRRESWVFSIVRDHRTRISHGLEHATIAVLLEQDFPVAAGHTHGPDRFRILTNAPCDDRLGPIRNAAQVAIQRLLAGERSLAYALGCGTSSLVTALILWLTYASALVVSFVVGAHYELFFALSVIAFRISLSFDDQLGLMAQRLWTVATDFTAAVVVDVRIDEPCVVRGKPTMAFEVVLDIRVAANTGGTIAPGVHPI